MAKELWQEEVAKGNSQLVADILAEIRDNHRKLAAGFDELKDRDNVTQATIQKLIGGFPAADLEGHRRYHESVIEWRDLRNRMVREGLVKVAQVGMLSGAGILVGVMWKTFKVSITQ